MRRSFLVPETAETARLRLRLPLAEDFDAYAAMLADPEVNRHIGGAMLADPDNVFRALGWQIGHWHLRGYGPWSVVDKATGGLVGWVGPLYPPAWPALEIAWTTGRQWWGQGLAAEAALAARPIVWAHLAPPRLISLVAPANERSARLASRLGCRKAEAIDIKGTACHVYEHPPPSASATSAST